MLNAAGSVEFGVGGALVGGERAGGGDAVRDGGRREVEVHGVGLRVGMGGYWQVGLDVLSLLLIAFQV